MNGTNVGPAGAVRSGLVRAARATRALLAAALLAATGLSVTGPAGWTCPAPSGQPGGAVVCRGARLSAGETAVFSVTMFVSATATPGSVLTAKAALEGSTPLVSPVPVVALPTTVTGGSTPTPLVPVFTG